MNSMKIGTYQMDTSFGLYLPDYTIPAPNPQTHFVSIIGRDGSIDLSNALGEIHYDSRLWELDFKHFDPSVNWHTLASQVMNALHGKRLNFTFDDDPNYFWTGRVSVSHYVSDHGTGTMRINISSDPYKHAISQTVITKTASAGTDETGEIVSLTSPSKIGGVSVAMQPVQTGSGTPSSSNIRPITGVSELNVYRSGKNIWNKTLSGSTFVPFPTEPGSTYTVTAKRAVLDTSIYLRVYKTPTGTADWDSIGAVISGRNITQAVTFTAESGYEYALWSNNSYNNVTEIQIETGSTATAYEPYNGSTFSAVFDEAVYGGTLDVSTGLLTVTMANIASYNGETIGEPWLSSMDEYAAGTTPTTGAQVVYTLSTPQTFQLSPQDVTTLTGQNSVWSDGGNVTVTIVTPETITNTGRPVVPTLTASADMVLKWGNYSASVQAGASTIPQFILETGSNLVYIIGTGTLSFAWQEASL